MIGKQHTSSSSSSSIFFFLSSCTNAKKTTHTLEKARRLFSFKLFLRFGERVGVFASFLSPIFSFPLISNVLPFISLLSSQLVVFTIYTFDNNDEDNKIPATTKIEKHRKHLSYCLESVGKHVSVWNVEEKAEKKNMREKKNGRHAEKYRVCIYRKTAFFHSPFYLSSFLLSLSLSFPSPFLYPLRTSLLYFSSLRFPSHRFSLLFASLKKKKSKNIFFLFANTPNITI